MSREASRTELFPRVWVLIGLVKMSTQANVFPTVRYCSICVIHGKKSHAKMLDVKENLVIFQNKISFSFR